MLRRCFILGLVGLSGCIYDDYDGYSSRSETVYQQTYPVTTYDSGEPYPGDTAGNGVTYYDAGTYRGGVTGGYYDDGGYYDSSSSYRYSDAEFAWEARQRDNYSSTFYYPASTWPYSYGGTGYYYRHGRPYSYRYHDHDRYDRSDRGRYDRDRWVGDDRNDDRNGRDRNDDRRDRDQQRDRREVIIGGDRARDRDDDRGDRYKDQPRVNQTNRGDRPDRGDRNTADAVRANEQRAREVQQRNSDRSTDRPVARPTAPVRETAPARDRESAPARPAPGRETAPARPAPSRDSARPSAPSRPESVRPANPGPVARPDRSAPSRPTPAPGRSGGDSGRVRSR